MATNMWLWLIQMTIAFVGFCIVIEIKRLRKDLERYCLKQIYDNQKLKDSKQEGEDE